MSVSNEHTDLGRAAGPTGDMWEGGGYLLRLLAWGCKSGSAPGAITYASTQSHSRATHTCTDALSVPWPNRQWEAMASDGAYSTICLQMRLQDKRCTCAWAAIRGLTT